MDLYVGAVCMWYAHGDISQKPAVALVTGIKQPGVLTLYKFPAAGGMPRMVDNVHHVSSERLQENMNLRLEYGGWDTTEAAELRRQESLGNIKQVPATVEEYEPKSEIAEDQKKILSYSEEGMTVDEIAEKMGRGWGPKKVGSVIDEHAQATA